MRDYGFSSYPSMVLIKNGEIVYSHSGKISESELSAQIEKHL
jgi:thioredoxin-like negative regulator of GroEL